MVKNKRKIIIVGVTVTVFLLTIGVSYALWQITLQQTDKNVITTGCFKMEFSDKSPIHLEKVYPISDEEGKNLVPYEFTITNTCDSKASFQINLETLNMTTLSDLSVMKMVLNELEKEATSKFLTSHEVVSKTLENATSSYKLKAGFLKAKESKTFNLRLWLDENTPTEEAYMNKTFESKVTIVTSYIVDETPPEVIASTSKNELNSITVDASDSFDEISGIETYSFRLENESWHESTEPIYTFSDLEYKEYTIEVQVSDFLGNKSEIKTLKEYPKVRATEYVNSLNGNGEVLNDETVDNNVRYIGANPKNYIDIGDRDASGNIIPWRIIGGMNNIKTTETGIGETRLKIIRAESIGNYSWDSSATNINSGVGINEWSQADINVLLNDFYYNSKSNQKCFINANNVTTTCDFSSIGLSPNSKKLLNQAVWNTGSNDGSSYTHDNITTIKFYELERSTNVKRICTSGIWCNDSVKRNATWTGLLGLLYPSDYGYATSGGTTVTRASCLNSLLYNWKEQSLADCKTNDWLHNSGIHKWAMMPSVFQTDLSATFGIDGAGPVDGDNHASDAIAIYPTLYLNSNINIISGTGELNNPFVVSFD